MDQTLYVNSISSSRKKLFFTCMGHVYSTVVRNVVSITPDGDTDWCIRFYRGAVIVHEGGQQTLVSDLISTA